ncbi:hypothetical protein ILYODFUR_016273 [Ilyodon furcidens]|uniref:Uncharacterized protein n=1 Tax=Ilyodon furcidens TaxID=33524 RepID=A0ABV0V3I6_9TELE
MLQLSVSGGGGSGPSDLKWRLMSPFLSWPTHACLYLLLEKQGSQWKFPGSTASIPTKCLLTPPSTSPTRRTSLLIKSHQTHGEAAGFTLRWIQTGELHPFPPQRRNTLNHTVSSLFQTVLCDFHHFKTSHILCLRRSIRVIKEDEREGGLARTSYGG